MNKEIKPLYRKEKKTGLSCHYYVRRGERFKSERNTKKFLENERKRQGMTSGRYGYDYTPLYMFLLSKVGQKWDEIYSEAKSRLDKEEPIWHIVAKNESEKSELRRCGESSRYSGLFVDEDNLLQKVNPDYKNEDCIPSCSCCTHTFNGKALIRKYVPSEDKNYSQKEYAWEI